MLLTRTGAGRWAWRLAGLLAAVLTGAAIPLLLTRGGLLLAVAVVIVGPLIARSAQRRLDVFEPIVWINVSLAMMFLVRPLAHLLYGSMVFRGLNLSPQLFDHALKVALIGSLAVQLGYFGTSGYRVARLLPKTAGRFDVVRMNALATILAALAIVGFVFFGAPSQVSSAYLYYLPYLIIPAIALSVVTASQQAGKGASRWVAAALESTAVVLWLPTGQRVLVMMAVVPLVIWHYLRTGRRPTARLLLLAFAGWILIASTGLLDNTTRVEGDLSSISGSLEATVGDLPGSFRAFVLGADVEMFSALARELSAVPSVLGYHPGNTLSGLLAHAVPRAWWPGKPRQSDDILNEYFDPGYQAGEAGPAYSVFGELYYDSGFVGVFIGSLLVGAVGRGIWRWRRDQGGTRFSALILAETLPFFVIWTRGNFQATFALALFVLGPLLIAPAVTAPARSGSQRIGGRRTWPPDRALPQGTRR